MMNIQSYDVTFILWHGKGTVEDFTNAQAFFVSACEQATSRTRKLKKL